MSVMGDPAVVAVVAILFLATFIRAAFGFGEALIAVPLLALLMPVEVAAPVAVLVSITVSGVAVVHDWRYIHFQSASRMVFFSLAGIPFGLLLLTGVAEPIVKALLGVVIAAFSIYFLASRKQAHLKNDRHAWFFGIGAGILGGAYGMNGPPLVVYGSLRHWSPEHFRATLHAYFLPTSFAVIVGYGFAGLWVPSVANYYLLALPAIVVAIFGGRAWSGRMKRQRFFRYMHIGLIVLAILLVSQAIV